MKNLAAKLLAIQKELKPVIKDADNPFFKSKYADINSVLSELRPLLNKHGVVVLQPLESSGTTDAPYIKTLVIDSESDETIDTATPLPHQSDPQKAGAAITYFRRYALTSMFLLESEEDDDGNSAAQPKREFVIPTRDEGTAPRCKDCNGPTKYSVAKKINFCAALCWKNPKELPTIDVNEPPFPG